jgi:hypothetical protein
MPHPTPNAPYQRPDITPNHWSEAIGQEISPLRTLTDATLSAANTDGFPISKSLPAVSVNDTVGVDKECSVC